MSAAPSSTPADGASGAADSPAQPDELREFAPLSPEEAQTRRRRSIVLAISLAGFVALIFAVTVVRLKEQVLVRPL